MIPSSFSGEGNNVVSAAAASVFSASLWGTGTVGAYRLRIYQNTAASALVYDTGVVTLSKPFLPRGYDGSENRFEVTVPAGSGMVNEFRDGYKWTLALWENYSASAPEDTRIISPEVFFWAKATPSVSIDASSAPTTITSRENLWKATYTSTSAVRWFQWTLAEVDGGTYTTIHQTGRIMQTPQIWFRYDGLVSGRTYAARVEVVNQFGVSVVSDWAVSSVSYATVTVASATEIRQVGHAVEVDWGGVQYIVGAAHHTADNTPSDGYEIVEDVPAAGRKALAIDSGTSVAFASTETFGVDIPADGTIVWSGTVDVYAGQNVLLLEWESGNADESRALQHEGFRAGLAPSATLTPDGTLAPDGGEGGRFRYIVGTAAHTWETAPGELLSQRYAVVLRADGLSVCALDRA